MHGGSLEIAFTAPLKVLIYCRCDTDWKSDYKNAHTEDICYPGLQWEPIGVCYITAQKNTSHRSAGFMFLPVNPRIRIRYPVRRFYAKTQWTIQRYEKSLFFNFANKIWFSQFLIEILGLESSYFCNFGIQETKIQWWQFKSDFWFMIVHPIPWK